jgi:acyl carrier protein
MTDTGTDTGTDTAAAPEPAAPPGGSAGDAPGAAAILAKLQQGYDVVKARAPRTLSRDDDITEDLDIDSLDFIDLVSVLEGEFPPEVVDAVIDRVPELRTVGDLVDTFIAVS